MTNYIDAHIGKTIRGLRMESRLHPSAFASTIGISVDALEDYENGHVRLPARMMMEVAENLGVHSATLFDGLQLGIPEDRVRPDGEDEAP